MHQHDHITEGLSAGWGAAGHLRRAKVEAALLVPAKVAELAHPQSLAQALQALLQHLRNPTKGSGFVAQLDILISKTLQPLAQALQAPLQHLRNPAL